MVPTMRRLTIVLLALICGSCSLLNPQPTPQQRAQYLGPMLSAAGFRIIPVDTPAKTRILKSLPPLKVNYYFDKDGVPRYWLADPYGCRCLYLGDQVAYQHYENLRLQNRIIRQEQETAEENLEASQNMQMDMMSPFSGGFGPGIGFGF
ncbi:MAG TPA: hypothetical protein VNE82_20890 [Candidatus Binataceae bacterium]|nr:hypothetical protein [Candidatus Binataceae bacterium]